MVNFILKIDSSDLKNKRVYLLKNEENVDMITGSDDLFVLCETLLKRNNLTYLQINEVIPDNKAGSLSGTKVDVTFANMFNFGRNLKKVYNPNYSREPNITLKNF